MPKKKNKLQTRLEYFVVRSIIGAIGSLSLKTSMRVGQFLGRKIGARIPKLEKTGRRNLDAALPELPEAEKEKILSGCFESLGRQLGVISHASRLNEDRLFDVLETRGVEHLAAAHRSGRGVILYTAHFGGWEIFGLIAPVEGFPLNLIVRRIDNPLVEALVEKMRTRFGSRTVDKKTSAREMFRLLRSGEILGIVADLNVQPHEGVFVDFFGVPAATTNGIAKLALRTNAVVLPAFAIWSEEKQKYLMTVNPPVEIEKTNDDARDVRELTQKITKVIEDVIRRHPEQWLWIHKRWKTRPEGEPSLYN